MRFEYLPEIVAETTAGARLLSHSLPVKEGWFTPSQTYPFFDGLLPEGDTRRTICRRLGLRTPSPEFELLAAIGRDCAGAVVVLPEDEVLSPDLTPIEWLSDDDVARMIDELPQNPLGLELAAGGMRLSLAGLQPKLVLTRDALGRWGRPTASIPSTHIIKVPQRGSDGRPLYDDIVVNELFCLRVLSESGLTVARAERRQFAGRDTLVVERFDRTLDETGRVIRIHQEDACQALARSSDQKYEDAPGGVVLRDLFRLVDEIGESPARERLRLLDQTIVNFTMGNADAHAKNVAVLYPSLGAGILSPMYDVVCTAVYPHLTTNLSIAIGGVVRSPDIGPDTVAKMARDVGLAERAAVVHAASLSQRLAACASATLLVAKAAGWNRPILENIVEVVHTNARQLGAR
jgi:serine/threonine-protein kinase HipA